MAAAGHWCQLLRQGATTQGQAIFGSALADAARAAHVRLSHGHGHRHGAAVLGGGPARGPGLRPDELPTDDLVAERGRAVTRRRRRESLPVLLGEAGVPWGAGTPGRTLGRAGQDGRAVPSVRAGNDGGGRPLCRAGQDGGAVPFAGQVRMAGPSPLPGRSGWRGRPLCRAGQDGRAVPSVRAGNDGGAIPQSRLATLTDGQVPPRHRRRRRESNPCTGLCRPLPKPLGHSATEACPACVR